jgi:hypothetical protein
MHSEIDIAFALGMAGGVLGAVLEARRHWTGVATWLTALAGLGMRFLPLRESISSTLALVFAAAFFVLVVFRASSDRRHRR